MDDKKYLLTLSVPFEAFDNLEARIKANRFCKDMGLVQLKGQVKLQQIFGNKPPEKVEL